MIFGWSKHQTGTGWWEPSRYLLMALIEKKLGHRREKVMRNPLPELLLGEPQLFQASISLLPFERRYRVATMTFKRSDIDTTAFNRGDHVARQAVAACIEAFFEVAFAGIPEPSRLPRIVGTHTHTGQLEVNIAMARGIWNAKGKVRSFNPDPPSMGSKNDYRNLNDRLNQHFGWQDPGCPSLRQPLKTANWIQKQAAESQRNFVAPAVEHPFVNLWIILKSVVDDLVNRAELLDEMKPILNALKLHVSNENEKSITIIRSENPSQKMVLRGRLVEGIQPSPADFEKRAEYLARVDERLTRSWEKRAAWNAARYSRGTWAEDPPDFSAIFKQPNLLLPDCHPQYAPKPKASSKQEPKPHVRARAKDMLTAHLAKLRENLTGALIYAGLFPQIVKSLVGATRNLKTKLEDLNAKLTDAPRHSDDPHADQRGADRRVDRPSEERDRKQRHRQDGPADAGVDPGIELRCSLDGQAEQDTREDQQPASPGPRDQHPESADCPDRTESFTDVSVNLRARHTGRLKFWKAVNRAVRACCQSSAVTTHLICPDNPRSVAIRGAGWRLCVSPGGIKETHGTLPAADFQRIAAAIRIELEKTDHLPAEWRCKWTDLGHLNDSPEDNPDPEFG